MTGTGSRRWNDFTYMYSLAEKYKKWDGDTSNEWYNKNIIIMTKKISTCKYNLRKLDFCGLLLYPSIHYPGCVSPQSEAV
jgi:hypothetical protein